MQRRVPYRGVAMTLIQSAFEKQGRSVLVHRWTRQDAGRKPIQAARKSPPYGARHRGNIATVSAWMLNLVKRHFACPRLAMYSTPVRLRNEAILSPCFNINGKAGKLPSYESMETKRPIRELFACTGSPCAEPDTSIIWRAGRDNVSDVACAGIQLWCGNAVRARVTVRGMTSHGHAPSTVWIDRL